MNIKNSEQFTGNIKWYNKDKGFGIVCETNSKEEIFIHHSNINGNNQFRYVILDESEPIKFYIDRNNKQKISAIDITPNGDKFQNERPFKNKEYDNKLRRHVRNTTDFKPSHDPVDMRIMIHSEGDKYNLPVSSKDIILVKNLFPSDYEIFNRLNYEINESKNDLSELWKLWHGNTHYIADDNLKWKQRCPTFNSILDKISSFFNMEIKATRLNYYSNSKEWKPFHHDAAAVKQDKASTQNFTVAVSFGLEREVAFQHAKNGTVISFPAENGSVYVFSKDVNIIWKHGIRQMKEDNYSSQGRFSIIAWGWREMSD